jgi:PKD domain
MKKIVGILICELLVITCFPIVNGHYNLVEVIDQEQPEKPKYISLYTALSVAQSFKPALSTLTKVELNVGKYNNPTGVVKVSIRDSLYGADLTSVSLGIGIISTSQKWVIFDFDDIEVIPEKTYYIILHKDSSWDSSHYLTYSYSDDNQYSRGEMRIEKSGIGWVYLNNANDDLTFRAYGLDNEPNNPTITGPTSGNAGTECTYKLSAIDIDGNDVLYKIDWNDTTTTTTGLNESGKQISVSHTWNVKGTYTVKVKAVDEYGAESNWTTLTVTMPCSFNKPMPQFLELLFQRFPHAFPLLRQLFGY